MPARRRSRPSAPPRAIEVVEPIPEDREGPSVLDDHEELEIEVELEDHDDPDLEGGEPTQRVPRPPDDPPLAS
jgi:hypothetical protein